MKIDFSTTSPKTVSLNWTLAFLTSVVIESSFCYQIERLPNSSKNQTIRNGMTFPYLNVRKAYIWFKIKIKTTKLDLKHKIS